MLRFLFLMCLTANLYAAESTVDIDTAAKIYQEAAIREQVRASLGAMPEHIRQLFASDSSAKLSDTQLAAVIAAAERGFRIDVFEAPALQALANHLDTATLNKTDAFLTSDVGKRMVSADVALAQLGETNIDKVMNGEITAPSTAKRDQIFDKLERATHSTESTVDIFLSMGQAVAVGTAVGSGMDPAAVAQHAHQSGESSRAGMEANMRLPMRRFMAYGYRDLSDSDLKRLLSFMESTPGKRYVSGIQCHGTTHRRTTRREPARTRPGADGAATRSAAARGHRRAAARPAALAGDPARDPAENPAAAGRWPRSDPPAGDRIRARAAPRRAPSPSGCCGRPARCRRASHARWRSDSVRPAAYTLRIPACRTPAPVETHRAA